MTLTALVSLPLSQLQPPRGPCAVYRKRALRATTSSYPLLHFLNSGLSYVLPGLLLSYPWPTPTLPSKAILYSAAKSLSKTTILFTITFRALLKEVPKESNTSW